MRRRDFLLGGGVLAPTAAAAGYATGVEPYFRLVETHWHPRPATWPEGLKLRIVALADIHMGPPQMTPDRLRRIVRQSLALAPDLVVLLGDYKADHPYVSRDVYTGDIIAILSQLQAPLGVWAVLGNHDWWLDRHAQARRGGPTFWHAAFDRDGIPVLENAAVKLRHRGQDLWLAGLGSQQAFRGAARPGHHDLAATLAPLADDDAPAILLAHEPDIFPKVPQRVALTLSGHTHGGQVRVLGYSPLVTSGYGNRFAYGHIIEHGRHLCVSGGLGCSRVPLRFGVPPEIMVVDLG
ncbi:metallophosphoesterase [Mesobaculum littorinae]|uniref:Metallophosphoesterase n=1 Tax=Mesobaculum littorinae TaxID=2486419 RepID=A0A438ACZ9_9RHOB|nr:metallophosphoesterase [Mesobaculum littorinae]RVV96559.1 metallophosphoesterase [Mesobaculum littorinae]